jgi:predicted RNase H-like HicB family nuclease
MKTIIQTYKEDIYYIAVDLITNVADQGLTEEEAVNNLKKGLEEHYQILMELAPKDQKISFLDIEVEKYVQTSRPVS